MTPSFLTLSDFERSTSRSLGFQCLISRKGVELGPMLLLIINRKPYMASPMTSSLLCFSVPGRSKSKSLEFWVEGNLHGIDIFTSSNITTLIWVSQKVVCWRAGFSAVPAVFLVKNCVLYLISILPGEQKADTIDNWDARGNDRLCHAFNLT